MVKLCSKNRLRLNASKGELMVIGNAKQLKWFGDDIKCEINGEQLSRMHKTKYLGIKIGECLNLDAQYKVIKRKLKAGLVLLRKLGDILTQSKPAQIYKALLESHLRYAYVVQGELIINKTYTFANSTGLHS